MARSSPIRRDRMETRDVPVDVSCSWGSSFTGSIYILAVGKSVFCAYMS